MSETTASIETDYIDFRRQWEAADPPKTATVDRSELFRLYGQQVQSIKLIGRLLGYEVTVSKLPL